MGPSKDTHGTMGPEQQEGRGWRVRNRQKILGKQPLLGPDHSTMSRCRALAESMANFVTVIAQDTLVKTLVVPCLRCGSFSHHKSVGGRGRGWQHALRSAFPQLPCPTLSRRRGGSFVGVSVFHLLVVSHIFCEVTPLQEFS